MEYTLTEADRKELKEYEIYCKRFLGRYDVEEMYGEESEKFDRRKFGKLSCGFCEHKFNPFYVKTLKVRHDWEWRWQGTEYKEPECDYECNCPKCKEQLNFTIYVAQ